MDTNELQNILKTI